MTDEDDLLAGEYALGILDDADAAAVRARMASDAVLGLRVAWWSDQLAPLAREIETAPQDALWTRIERSLPGNDNGAANSLVKRWRAIASGAMAVAAALLLFIVMQPATTVFVPTPVPVPQTAPQPTPQPAPEPAPQPLPQTSPLVAMLSSDETAGVVSVSYDADRNRLTIASVSLDRGAGDAQLWVIPEGGKPYSLGIIEDGEPRVRTVDRDVEKYIRAGATFAISQEPRGGSPTGQPTGPVTLTGKTVRT